MTVIAKVGPKGQIVIPKEIRDALDIRPGSAVALRWRDDRGVVELSKAWDNPIADGPAYIQSIMPTTASAASATETLLAMRAEDLEIEERQYRRWTGRLSSSTRPRS